jgi:hypothetical protein
MFLPLYLYSFVFRWDKGPYRFTVEPLPAPSAEHPEASVLHRIALNTPEAMT